MSNPAAILPGTDDVLILESFSLGHPHAHEVASGNRRADATALALRNAPQEL